MLRKTQRRGQLSLLKREYYTKISEGMFFAQMQRYSVSPFIGGHCWGEVIRDKSGTKGIFRGEEYNCIIRFIGDRTISVRQSLFPTAWFFGLFLLIAVLSMLVCSFAFDLTTSDFILLFTIAPIGVIMASLGWVTVLNGNWKKIEKVLFKDFACYSKD